MKYFIDFEATQFSSEIISVGCVNAAGEEFYSLVHPKRMGKMTEFITELTGITKDELRDAPDADRVFADFYKWMKTDEQAQFYCYGNCDAHFVKNTLRYVTDFDAQAALSIIYASVYDYSGRAKEYFKTDQTVGLAKLVAYYSGETIDQKHNSLEDAVYLKYVYEQMHLQEQPTECPFPEYLSKKRLVQATQDPTPRQYKRYVQASNAGGSYIFPTYGKAADWVIETLLSKNMIADDRAKSRIANRIANAVARRTFYYGFSWSAGSN